MALLTGGPRSFVLRGVDLFHPNQTPCSEFLLGANALLGGRDLSMPLKILSDHWVENVGDLRLLVQEGLLRGINLPIRLCVWIEDELARVVAMNGALPVTDEQKQKRLRADDGKGVLFRYTSDFDANGVLYWLGTAGGTRVWMNPADALSITITTSGLMQDSVSPNALAGRDTVRCVTASEPGAFFAIDLHDNFLYPTHYSLKHYISWDTECVRDWRLEGSVDRTTWVVLRDHKADTGVNGKGGTKTWSIPMGDEPTMEQLAMGRSPSPHLCFCMFRIIMTGPNSNGHLYLACSGFEIYGLLHATGRPTRESLQSLVSGVAAAAAVSAVIPSALPLPPFPLRLEGNNEGGAAQALNPFVAPAVLQPRATVPPDVREFKHTFDFDNNGILYYLASGGGTRAWSNPADQGLVTITSSSLMADSAPINSFCGSDVVRCVTRPQPDSWFAIDFKERSVRATAYTLRHYSSWDAEAVRNWRFEGSITGERWIMLSQHDNDESLNAKGSTKTWFLPDTPAQRQPYRFFRIFQTGENSNKHHYLAISGFEIYGAIYHADGITPLPSSSLSLSSGVEMKGGISNGVFTVIGPGLVEFKHVSDFDGRGLIHYMATEGLQKPWRNPADQLPPVVNVIPSSLAPDSTPASAVVGQDVVRCVTKAEPKSWFVIDLCNVTIRPAAYTLRHYSSWDTEAVRNWVFQGSMDGESWTTLREHIEDGCLEGKGSTMTWSIEPSLAVSFYRFFRIYQTGPNSNKHHYLAVSGFELYGIAKMPDVGPLSKAHENIAPFVPSDPTMIKHFRASSLAAAPGGPLEGKGAAMFGGDAKIELSWDDENRAPSLEITNRCIVRNMGSADKWQLVRSLQSWDRGRVGVQIRIVKEPKTTNTWRFIIGVIPSTVDCKGAKQWVGTSGSWGYIGGTGGKCHAQPKSLTYGAKYTQGDVVGIIMDFGKGTVEFFKNSISQGIAFENLVGRCHVAASLTAADSTLSIHHWDLRLEDEKEVGTPGWDIEKKSQFLDAAPASGLVTNTGSSDKWQSIRSIQMFGQPEGSGLPVTGTQYFDVEIVSNPATPNSWQFIVGAVPASFTCSGTKQWVGASKSWGYIAGTGGKCYDTPASMTYGDKYGFGDVIGCQLDWDAKTIEFFKNGVSQGLAFTTLTSPAFAAVSLTGTGASARLRIRKL